MKNFKLFESENQYYWVPSKNIPIQPGFQIPPGPTTFTNDLHFPRAIVEQVFETVRKKINPSAPSRIGGIFLCQDINCCRYYQKVYKTNALYKVKIESHETPFLTDSDAWGDGFHKISRWTVYSRKPIDFETAYELGQYYAEKYWQPSDIEQPEVLVAGSAKVIVV